MLMDVLIASLLSLVIFLGLFELAHRIVEANEVASRVAIARSQLLSLESAWRLRDLHVEADSPTRLSCSSPPVWLAGWCDRWQRTLSNWGEEGELCLIRNAQQWRARLRVGAVGCEGHDRIQAEHRWPVG